jgi:hypothetical protein
MTSNNRPYLSIQDIKAIAPGLIGYMQKRALDRINNTIDDIYDNTHVLALRSLYFRLYDTEYLKRDEIAKIFALLEPVVEFHVDKRLSKGQIATVLNDVGQLLGGKVDLTHLVPTFNTHKKAVVTHILAMIKNNGIIEPIRNYIDILTTLNLNWPELEIMNKSSQSLNEGTYQPNPATMISMIKTYKGRPGLGPLMSSLFTYKNIGGDMSAIDADAKDTILPVLQKPATLKNFHRLSEYLSQSAILFGWPELRDIKLGMMPVMIKYLEKYQTQPHYADTATYASHMISIMRNKPNVLEEAKSQLVSVINSRKKEIIIDLLTLFKHGNVGPVLGVIHDFRSIGIDWPEFVAIEKSADASRKPKPLTEAASLSSLLNYAEKNVKQLVKGDVQSFYHLILGLEKLARGRTAVQLNDPERDALLTQALFKNKAAIVDHVDSLVNGSTPEQQINGLFAIQLLKRLRISWPELQQFIDTRALDIIKYGLTNYSIKTGLDIMKTVEALGIPKNQIADALREVAKKLLAEIDSMLDENAVQVGIENRFRLFKRFGINYKMKKGPLKTKMLNRLDTVLGQQGLTPGSVGLIELITNYSADVAATVQEIAALMQKHKTPVVKRLLQDFKNENTYNLDDYLKTLKQLKLNWPELDIIFKSMRSGLNESLDAITANNAMTVLFRILRVNWQAPKIWERKAYEQFIEDHKQQILDHFRHRAETVWPKDDDMSISTDIFMAMGLQFNGKDWPELKEIFEQNREPIIRQLLKTVKFHEGVKLYAKDILMTLLAMGFEWPELEVLKRSMNASQRRGIGYE